MEKTKIFLVRQATYDETRLNSGLSEHGRYQAAGLGRNIKEQLNPGSLKIWSSSAVRARETAYFVQRQLQVDSIELFEKLWSDKYHAFDFSWLEEMIKNFEGDNLIIVTHSEYVNYFP